jgi:hypothetical protein
LRSNEENGPLNLRTRAVIQRSLHEWVLDVGVQYEKATNDLALIFGFGPKGWGLYKNSRRAAR